MICNTIYNYPIGLTVFSTVNELEFREGDLKPARKSRLVKNLLSDYTRFVLENERAVEWEEEVLKVEKSGENHFRVISAKGEYVAQSVLFAFGAMISVAFGREGRRFAEGASSFSGNLPVCKKNAMVIGGGNSAGEAALFLAEEGANAILAIFRGDWENNDPKQGCIKYWVKQPLEDQLSKECLKVYFLDRVVEIKEKEIVLENENGEIEIFPNDVVFILIGADADLTMLKHLGRRNKNSKYGEVPVYDKETYETNISGIYVVGHFTKERHISGAIQMPKKIIPKLAAKIKW